jgi:hypothetical protein
MKKCTEVFRVLQFLLLASLSIALTGCALPQPDPSNVRPMHPDGTHRYNTKFAYFSPNEDHLLVTLCQVTEGRCWPWRYFIDAQRWEKVNIVGAPANASFGSAVYSKDASKMVLEMTLCTGPAHNLLCLLKDFKIAVLETASARLTVIPSEQTRFLPSFAPDGKNILYWGLENATPSGSGRAIYASVGVYLLDADSFLTRKVIDTKAQLPLAPITAVVDAQTVALAASEIRGEVMDNGVVHKFGMSGLIDDSLILANILNGSMRTLLPKGKQFKVLYEMSMDKKSGFAMMRERRIVKFAISDSSSQQIILDFSENPLGKIRHLQIANKDRLITFIAGRSLRLGETEKAGLAAIIATPLW